QRLRQSLGKYLPPGLRVCRSLLMHRFSTQRRRLRREPHNAARVIVDSQKIDRLFDELQVLRRPAGPCLTEDLVELFRVAAEEDWIEILTIHVGIGVRDRVAIGLLIRGPMLGLEVDDDSDTMLAFGTIRLHRLAMRTQQVMCRNGRRATIAMPGR